MTKTVFFAVFLGSIAVAVRGQHYDPTSPWPAIVATEDRIYPNIVYSKVGGYELKLNVITGRSGFQTASDADLFSRRWLGSW